MLDKRRNLCYIKDVQSEDFFIYHLVVLMIIKENFCKYKSLYFVGKRERRHYLYEKFEKLLEERGVTAYEVAKQTGIASTTLSAWKKGEYTPKIDKLCKIANYFEIPVTYFIQ